MNTPEGTYCPPAGCLYILNDTCVIYTGPSNSAYGVVTGQNLNQVLIKLLAHSFTYPSWGNITGTLSNQIDLQAELDLKYDVSNPAGYITSADIPAQQNSDWNSASGVTEILNKPTLLSQFTNDLPNASSTVTGLLTSTDWNTFNNKASSTGTANRIPFYNGSGVLTTDDSIRVATNFGDRLVHVYDATNTIFTSIRGGDISMTDGTNVFDFGINGILLPSLSSIVTIGHAFQSSSRVYIAGGTSIMAPLTIASGPLLISPTAGVIENDGNHLYYTADAGTRYQLDQQGFGTTAGGELAGTYPNPTLLNSAVIGKVITGYVSGAGTVAATDSILQAIQKLNGNQAALVTGVSSVSNSDSTLIISPTTGAVIASLNLANANTWTAIQKVSINSNTNQECFSVINSNAGASAQSRITLFNNNGSTSGVNGGSLFICSSAFGSGYANSFGVWNYQNGPIVFATNNSEKLRIFAGGNVVIGTTTDNTVDKLQVNGSLSLGIGTSSSGGLLVLQNNLDNQSIVFSNGAYLSGGARFIISQHGAVLSFTSQSTAAGQSFSFVGGNPDTAHQGSVMKITGTFNQAAQRLDGLLLNVTNTTSLTGSTLVDFQIGGSSKFNIQANTSNVLIGTTTDVATAALQIASTTKGFLPPVMTTTQKNAISSPAEGLIVYDNVLKKHYGYDGTTWQAFY